MKEFNAHELRTIHWSAAAVGCVIWVDAIAIQGTRVSCASPNWGWAAKMNAMVTVPVNWVLVFVSPVTKVMTVVS